MKNNEELKNFEKLQLQENELFYEKNASKIYGSFLTFENDLKIPLSHAKTIINNFQNKNINEINIAEIGIGNANLSINLIKQLKKHFLKLKINYFLIDKSKNIINFAKNNIKKNLKKNKDVKIKYINRDVFNLNDLKNIKFDVILSNELIDDIGSRIFFKNKNKIYEVLFQIKKEKIKQKKILFKTDDLEFFLTVKTMLDAFDENYHIPITTGFKKYLNSIKNLLNKDSLVIITDYGFYSFQDIEVFDSDLFSKTLIRRFSNQITIDVNFLYLSAISRSFGFNVNLQKQKDYVKNTLNKKIFLIEGDDLRYYTLDEIKKQKEKIESYGYFIDNFSKDFDEDDGYYCLILKKPL